MYWWHRRGSCWTISGEDYILTTTCYDLPDSIFYLNPDTVRKILRVYYINLFQKIINNYEFLILPFYSLDLVQPWLSTCATACHGLTFAVFDVIFMHYALKNPDNRSAIYGNHFCFFKSGRLHLPSCALVTSFYTVSEGHDFMTYVSDNYTSYGAPSPLRPFQPSTVFDVLQCTSLIQLQQCASHTFTLHYYLAPAFI